MVPISLVPALALLYLLLLLLLTANGFTPGGSVLQCKRGQYNTIQYNKTQHSRQTSISKIATKNQEKILYPIKAPKLLEPKVDGRFEDSVRTLWLMRYS